jgi:hypothetical protein
VNQSGRGVSIAHFGRDLMLVRDEERPRQWSVIPERAVYRACSARSDPRQYVGRLLTLLWMSSRTLGRRRRDGENRRCRENQGERGLLRSGANERRRESNRSRDDRDPAKPAEPSEKAADVRQVCGCDEWQLDSDRALPNARSLPRPARNHSASRAIKASGLHRER